MSDFQVGWEGTALNAPSAPQLHLHLRHILSRLQLLPPGLEVPEAVRKLGCLAEALGGQLGVPTSNSTIYRQYLGTCAGA